MPTVQPTTLRQAVSAAAARLSAAKDLAATAARDAELIILHTLKVPRSTLYADPDRRLTEAEQAACDASITRRLTLEPVQYITGKQEFFGLELEVGPGVLIPRPETELLVEAALSRLPHDRPVHLLDVGTGSGGIAIALASRLPHAKITAIDLSEAALKIARRNIRTHNLEARIELLASDLLAALPDSLPDEEIRFDAILSNPPYVPQSDRALLHAEVRDHEPAEALFAGDDGLEIYRRLIPQAHVALGGGGLLGLEIGFEQRDAIADLLKSWHAVQFLDDLQGIPRVAIARRP